MATIVNTTAPAPAERTGNGLGVILAVLFILLALFLVLYYGLPALRRAAAPAPAVTVPDQIDVNVQTPQGQ